MSTESINEPGTSRLVSHTPMSVNEPPAFPVLPDMPAPVITAIAPTECAIGDDDFTLDVTGENFFEGSVIFFAGHDEPTSFDGTDTLSTGVKPSLWGSPVVVQCQVHNGEVMSNAVDFAFNDASGSRMGNTASHASEADPDELEDEIELAEEEGDFKPTHRARTGQAKKKRK